jgi:hypothetical protein
MLGDAQIQNSHIVRSASVAVLAADEIEAEPVKNVDNVEAYVRAYYRETPILAEVARCESQFRQVGKDGKVLRGRVVPDDLGVMQVNAYFHEDTAKKLGFDLYSLDGNLAYAKNLYERQGLRPWSASAPCWDK